MKINKFLLGAFALSVGFASCSDDDLVKGNDVAKVDETRYMSVQISSPSQVSRAYENGTEDESDIKSLSFLFYDAEGNPTASKQILNLEGQFEVGAPGTSGDNVTRIATSVVPVELIQGANIPAQVLCFVNADAKQIQLIEKKTLDQIRDEQRDYFNNGNEFIMSNSVYFGLNTLTGTPDARLCASPINSQTQLFPSRDKAEEAIKNSTDGALVNIYVERLAAKVGLTMAADAPQTYTLKNGDGEGTIDLTYTPEYWFMNGTANNTYITKRYGIDEGNNNINMKPTFAEINGKFNGTGMADTWNAPNDFRSFWGCSPSYYKNVYPLVSDQVNNLESGTQDEEKTEYFSTYYSYNDVKAQAGVGNIAKQALSATGGAFSLVNTGEEAQGYIYAHETTTAISTIHDINGNPAAAVASAVIVGRYQAAGANANSTFYVDRNNDVKGTYYGSAATAKSALYKRQTIVFADDKGTELAPESTFALMHPTSNTRAKLVNPYIAGRLVTLQLTAVPSPAVYVYDADTNNFVAVTADNLDAVNAQLVSIGYLDMFAEGLAFFNIPIRHLGWGINVPANETDEEGNITVDNSLMTGNNYNWKNMRLGDLGLVRNHVYTVEVTGITGLGTGLRDPEQPIIPAKETVNQYVAVRLNVLAWNVVPSWKVEL